MRQANFIQGALVAAVLAFAASATIAALTPFLGTAAVLRLVIPGLALCYLLYLFSQSTARVGRITALTIWSCVAAITWWASPSLPLYLLIHVLAVWLLRSLYFYSGVLPATADLGLSAFSVIAMVWAVSRTGSAFLAIWCFFLVQALFVAIPPALRSNRGRSTDEPLATDRFERARRQADRALRQLASGQS